MTEKRTLFFHGPAHHDNYAAPLRYYALAYHDISFSVQDCDTPADHDNARGGKRRFSCARDALTSFSCLLVLGQIMTGMAALTGCGGLADHDASSGPEKHDIPQIMLASERRECYLLAHHDREFLSAPSF